MGEARTKSWTLALCVVAAAGALWCADARAASLDDGVQAYEDMELDDAADKLAKALRTSSLKEKPRIELWLGIVELERGNEATARRWLKQALRANPKLTVEQELSPKIVASIEAVRTQVTSSSPPKPSVAPSAVAPPIVLEEAPPASVVVNAPVAAAAPVIAAPAHVAPAPAPAPVPVVAPPVATQESAPPVAQNNVERAPPTVEGGPSTLLLVTAATGAVSAGALVGGAVLGTIARVGADAAQNEPVATAATKRYQDASSAAVAANGLFIAGGVAAMASALCGVLVFVDGEGP